MGLRQDLGGKLEDVLNKLVDEKVTTIGKELMRAELHKLADKLVDEHYEKLMGGLAAKLKADVIDLIDGEDDLK